MSWLDRYDDSLNLVSVLLWPMSLLFAVVVRVRRQLYLQNFLKSESLKVPVVVVGNINMGGTGKTPLVGFLVKSLREKGYSPGVISRGYGGHVTEWPCHVTADSDPDEVGDEPVLLAQRCQCPIVVGPDRVAAAQALLKAYDCNIIVSDDGLQHYRLQRDLEIAVIDGFRRFGNAACLPAGPLREPVSRLHTVDFVVGNGAARGMESLMSLHGDVAVNLSDPGVSSALSGFSQSTVHAVAGIGDPGRFFDHLRRASLRLIEHPFPDHYSFRAEDLKFQQDFPVLMTEKDAVKCRKFKVDNAWYVPVEARLEPGFEERFFKRLMPIALSKGIQIENRASNSDSRRVSKTADSPETRVH
ncbi:MAG: tetraacyldisaccharide 4'-kinase [Candidatus Contendobacter odensis]|uniref:Tetraacyldisaccharide 4'-kinase n=1 Tax=Candidatus Contendibacter odensensis TaxID=1400860 RepID=A0A2G6PGB6_9GAMM|nr:MAG: tetraacyldisaccharide 4'-kinase [Candidatus Contendobacter odensis]